MKKINKWEIIKMKYVSTKEATTVAEIKILKW